MKKKILSLLAVLAVAAGISLVAASPAQAAYTDCTPTLVGCFYYDSNGNGARWDITSSLGCKNFNSAWNDKVSSIRNQSIAIIPNRGYLIQWWEDANCSGSSQYWAPTTAPHNGNMSAPWNDEASSYAIYECISDLRC